MSNEMTDAYIDCALWSSQDTVCGEWVNLDSGAYLLAPDTQDYLERKCQMFYDANRDTIEAFCKEFNADLSQVGHSLWLSQNGHGAGFFDFGTVNGLGDRLHHLARGDKTELYIGDDDMIHH